MKINKKIKTILPAVAIIISFSLWVQGTKAAAYNYYVDAKSTETQEDGSSQHPWKTISAAVAYIDSNNLKKKTIFVKKGTYNESLTLSRNTSLFGEDKNETVINADGKNNAINFSSTKSKIKNLKVKNAEASNIIVSKKSKVSISDCIIEKAGNFGIEVKESSATDRYKFTLDDSKILDSGSQGLYISRRKISVTDSEIASSNEEGVDLHQGVKGRVVGNNIHGNKESGIESILTGTNLSLRSNEIENNHAQGITVQIYTNKKGGKIKITNNTIKGNSHYGIRYANYTHKIGPKKFKIFADKYVKKSKNKISGNGDGDAYYQ
ncbi:MAG: pectinesterase family protein [Parcubacteria group bacterium]